MIGSSKAINVASEATREPDGALFASARKEIWVVQFSERLSERARERSEDGVRFETSTARGNEAQALQTASAQSMILVATHAVSTHVSQSASSSDANAVLEQGIQRSAACYEPTVVEMRAFSENEGRSVVRLLHPDLGMMTVIIDVRGTDVEVRVHATARKAAEWITGTAETLRTRLVAQGLDLRALHVGIERPKRRPTLGSVVRHDSSQNSENEKER